MNTKVLSAVFQRNLMSYFANPTGYVFICVFVLLSSIAAFLPDEFFNANLANLDQLNRWFPLIMLVFIPAITMSIWAQERQQGTDELLLTLPAGDFEVVLGKYLAAIAIYSVSLLFSLICNYTVLQYLGNPDTGLFLSTYLGYWMVGLAMLAIGMVASFLTHNLTIAYILGALLNAPLIALIWAGSTHLSYATAAVVKRFSIGGQFAPFGRGVVSLSSIIFFVTLACIMVYLCKILIGRRHWTAKHALEGTLHYTTQAASLVVIAICLVVLFNRFHIQGDMTSEKLNSLAPDTVTLISDMEPDSVVQIEAFISPQVPEPYIQTRLDMINVLNEIAARGGNKVDVKIIDTEPYSEQAQRAEARYEITPQRVHFLKADVSSEEKIFLGVAFKCGVRKPVIINFIDRGIPVEYELIRSLCTVTQQERKRIGVLKTDAGLFGQADNPMAMMQGGSQPWRIIAELEKMYEVFEVDPAAPIEEEMDALLAVQPSSLDQNGMDNFMAVVRRGVPTAVFEDPVPALSPMPGTTDPKTPPNPMMRQPPEQKGDISVLWDLLGVRFGADKIVWTNYNPYPKLAGLPKEFVFVDTSKSQIPGVTPFNEENPITSKLQHVAFPFPGYLDEAAGGSAEFTPLVHTTKLGGTVTVREMWDQMMMMFGQKQLNQRRRLVPDTEETSYVLAAQITGPLPDQSVAAENADSADEAAKAKNAKLNVVLVADADLMSDQFFAIRQMGNVAGVIEFDFDNVTFLLNILDDLSGDTRFLELRKRRPIHRTLETIDARTKDAKEAADMAREQAQKEFDDMIDAEENKLKQDVADLEKDLQSGGWSSADVRTELDRFQKTAQERLNTKTKLLEQQRDEELDKVEASLQNDVRKVQDTYKLWAVLVPPILPLMLAILVFFVRRQRESEGVNRDRLR